MKKIIKTSVCIVIGALFAACTSDVDDLFDKTAEERIQAAMQADNEVLMGAQNGWLMEYYASADSVSSGMFSMLLKFNEDQTVTVASEVSSDPAQQVTTPYTIKQSAGPVLAFDMYNSLFHLLAEVQVVNGKTTTKWPAGDFEFAIVSATSEKVVLQGKKKDAQVILTPMDKDWTEYLTTLKAQKDSVLIATTATLVGGDATYMAANSKTKKTYTFSSTNGLQSFGVYAYKSTEKGFKFLKPVTIGDIKFDELVYDAKQKRLIDRKSVV